ncbi:MAG: hypothetical protein NVS2B16_33740 [Chloroflexota bacterium]
MNGDPEPLYVLARKTLLDALEILGAQRAAVILVGAQAIYLHVGEAHIAVAVTTKDADLVLDTRKLTPTPQIQDVLRDAGFESERDQIGIWRNRHGGQVDFLVPEAFAGPKGRRAARLSTQGNALARRAKGLEGALIDNQLMEITSLNDEDDRRMEIPVAGPGALLVAKLYKVGERQAQPTRMMPKDALDVLRLLQGIAVPQLAKSIKRQLTDPISASVAQEAVGYLDSLFGSEAAKGSELAATAVEGLDDPDVVRASVAILASDLLNAIGHEP